MRFLKRCAALGLALALALGLSACSLDVDEMRDQLSDIIIEMAVRFGFVGERTDEDEVTRREGTAGGSIVFPEDFVNEGESMVTMLRDGVLYVDFRSITNKATEYFVATADSVTVTIYATSSNTEAETPPTYKMAVWELTEDATATAYVDDSTVYLPAAGEGNCYTATVSGLTPGRRYKINLSYDSTYYKVTGRMTVSPVSDEELFTVDDEA